MAVDDKFCNPEVLAYDTYASERSDNELLSNLFETYPTLTYDQRKLPGYRKWRRCVIVELLKRGLIDKDPGVGPPERSGT